MQLASTTMTTRRAVHRQAQCRTTSGGSTVGNNAPYLVKNCKLNTEKVTFGAFLRHNFVHLETSSFYHSFYCTTCNCFNQFWFSCSQHSSAQQLCTTI